MAEFKLGRIRFIWKGTWTTGTTYVKDDVVRNGGKTYLCVVGHVADTDFYTDLDNIPTRWNQVSDGSEWRDNWTVDTFYNLNDIVKYGGYVYICKASHTSAATLELGLEDNQADWDVYAESLNWTGDWLVDTRYRVNDVVKYGGQTYVCNEGHTSAATLALGLEPDQAKWDLIAESFDWKGDWVVATRYKKNDVVKYGGTSYVCNTGHTSAATDTLGLEADQGKWDYLHKGLEYKFAWSGSSVRYKINDIVKWGADLWICTTEHTSTGTFAESNWQQFVEGVEFDDSWNSSTIYQPGDIVTYGGYIYICKTNHSNQVPTANSDDWDLYATGFKLTGDWSGLTAYKVGNVVRLNGYTYVAVTDNTNSEPPSANWERLNSGIRWQGIWADATDYKLGDTVKQGPTTFICVLGHTSSVLNRPDVDAVGTYWNAFSAGFEESVLTTKGDLVYYSEASPTRLAIGAEGQVLKVVNNQPAWEYYGVIDSVYYVAPNGVDAPAPGYGITLDKPWKTVRYANEQVERGAKYPNANLLLKHNIPFIAAEAVEWTDYQIANSLSPYTIGFTYDKELCQRDMVRLTFAVLHDLTHGGNVRTREAALAYFTSLGALYITGQEAETVATIEFAKTLVASVLANTVPAVNYQTLNGVVSPVNQIIDTSVVSEDVQTIINNLFAIVTDAITAGVSTGIPATVKNNNTIFVKTGRFDEVLPIIVADETAVVGDELRGTRIHPAGNLIATADQTKSLEALTYLKSITDEVVAGSVIALPKQSTVLQNTSHPAGSVGSTTAVSSVSSNITEIIDIVTNGLGSVNAFVYPTPTGGTGNASNAGYFNGARLVLANKAFLQAEISAWINVQIAGATSPFAGFVYGGAGQTACERDVGYIVDALVYDLTYGGNLETSVAARSYYSKGIFVETGEKDQALAVQVYLKSIIDNIVTASAITPSAGNAETQDVSGTAGSAGAALFAQDRIQEIYNTINTGVTPTEILPDTSWVSAGLLTAGDSLAAKKAQVQADAIGYVKTTYPTLVFDETLCSRDVGYMVDALRYDLLFGSNYRSIKAAMSYYRGLASTGIVLAEQKTETLGMLTYLNAKIKFIVASGASVQTTMLWDEAIGYITTTTRPLVSGTNTVTDDLGAINGALSLLANKDFLAAEAVAYIADNYFVYDSAKCSRDIGLIIDSVGYDMALGTNYNAVTAGLAYLRSYSSEVITSQKTETLYGITFAKTESITAVTGDATSVTRVTNAYNEIIDIIDNGEVNADAITFTTPTGADTDVVNAKDTLVANRTFLREEVIGWIDNQISSGVWPDFTYNSTLCSRDVGRLIDAVCYDLLYGGNSATVQAATAYYYGAITLVPGQEKETALAIVHLRNIAKDVILNTTVTPVYSAEPQVAGTAATAAEQAIIGGLFDVFAAVVRYGLDELPTTTYPDITWTDSAILAKRSALLSAKPTIQSDTIDEINTTYDGYTYNINMCARDVKEFVEAIAYDLIYTGNYRTTLAARYYVNAVATAGSVEEDMFYLRNGTGLRNCTLQGLTGTLGPVNGYGTRRPSAGAYASLDPGWGGNDYRAWITNKSPYVQNVTTFGTACVGQKIDGALHHGGNDSIVSNDFTQVLSDGIGAWVTNGGRAELVSVFSYYGHIGYLAENGGKIRATNGNSSYGEFGCVSEGVDVTETPVLATINNRAYEALVGNVVTSGDRIYRLEYLNAGSAYNSATVGFTGTGIGVTTVMNEFRDGAVFETRLTDTGTVVGGEGYETIENVAQSGSATNITIAATDPAISSAYVGMRIQIVSGAGVGQYANILIYNSGSKLATVVKDSYTPVSVTNTTVTSNEITTATAHGLTVGDAVRFGSGTAFGNLSLTTLYYVHTVVSSTVFKVATSTAPGAPEVNLSTATGSMFVYQAGWDHVVSGTPIFASLDGTTAYIIEPKLAYSSPGFTATSRTQIADNWVSAAYGDINASYVAVATTGGIGAGANFTITRTGVAYATVLNSAGTDYAVDDELTIAGTSLGGFSPANDLTITVTAVNTVTGAITNFTASGTGRGGNFVAVAGSGTGSAYSTDGITWTAGGALPASSTWTSVAYGAPSGVSTWVAVQNGSNNTARSTNGGVTWASGASLPADANWAQVVYGGDRFMAIATGGTDAAYSTNGTSWSATNALPSTADWTSVAYGAAGVWVAVASGGTKAAYSTNGQTWTAQTLPSVADWSSVVWGNGKFVAISTGGTDTAYSLDGITWYAAGRLPTSNTWDTVRYAQGLFVASATVGTANSIATSENGLLWIERTIGTLGAGTRAAVAFGNPDSNPLWVVLSSTGTTAASIVTGATAKGRAKVVDNAITQIRMCEPGSGYTSSPTVTIVDPNNTVEATTTARVGVGALANPTFTNRGTLWATASASINGNGYSDIYQLGSYINVSGLPSSPIPGSNVQIDGIPTYYKLVTVTAFVGTGPGLSAPYTATLQISPTMEVAESPAHGTGITIRIKYSQVRLTGHDFLSIGTGNFAQTNYPGLPLQNPVPDNETQELGGGRVFYTSTDQDGNFRVGTLFSVEQATGVATLNADAFNIAGLNELSLGAVALGGSGAVITEFSTDPYFTADSDNIVSTQRAVKAYINSQIGGGGSSLNVNTLTAGVIYVASNEITTTTGVQIDVKTKMNFTGGIDGSPLAMALFLHG